MKTRAARVALFIAITAMSSAIAQAALEVTMRVVSADEKSGATVSTIALPSKAALMAVEKSKHGLETANRSRAKAAEAAKGKGKGAANGTGNGNGNGTGNGSGNGNGKGNGKGAGAGKGNSGN